MPVLAEQPRRNPFQYVEPPPVNVEVERRPLRPPVTAPEVAAPQAPAPEAGAAPPQPPRFPYHLIGLFGRVDNPIAAFVADDRVITVQLGDTIDGEFVIRRIGIEGVEIGFVHHPSTQRVQLDGWL